MLSGLTDPGPGMFQGLTENFSKPDADDMDKAREAAMYDKIVRFTEFKAVTYDLGTTDSKKKYEKKMCELMEGMQTQTHSVLFHDRRFIEDASPRWIVHIEWAEFELDKKPVQPVGTSGGDDG